VNTIICDLMQENWTDPFHCTIQEPFGKAKRRMYHVAKDIKLFGVTTMLGDDEPPAYAWSEWIAQEAVRLFALHESGRTDNAIEAVWNGERLEWVSNPIHASSRLTVEYLKGEGRRRSQAAMDRGTVVELLLEDWKELGFITKGDLGHWLTDKLTQYRRDGIPYQCTFDEAYPFAESLRDWLEETGAEVVATNIFVLNPEAGYATVIDAYIKFGGVLYSCNLKTASSANRKHAMQVAAEHFATHWVPPGTLVAEPYETIRKAIVPAIVLCTKEGTRLRKLEDAEYWYDVFELRRQAFVKELAAMPFETVKEGK